MIFHESDSIRQLVGLMGELGLVPSDESFVGKSPDLHSKGSDPQFGSG